jgi:hypothetical protein
MYIRSLFLLLTTILVSLPALSAEMPTETQNWQSGCVRFESASEITSLTLTEGKVSIKEASYQDSSCQKLMSTAELDFKLNVKLIPGVPYRFNPTRAEMLHDFEAVQAKAQMISYDESQLCGIQDWELGRVYETIDSPSCGISNFEEIVATFNLSSDAKSLILKTCDTNHPAECEQVQLSLEKSI